jgi:CBS domain-containing protein
VTRTRNTTVTIAAFGVGYILGVVVRDRPLRLLGRTASRTRAGVSSVSGSIAKVVPVRPRRHRRRDHDVVDVRPVGDVMRAVGTTIGPKATLRDAAATMQRAGLDEMLVVKKQRPRGLVSRRDVAAAVARGLDPRIATVRDVLRPVQWVPVSATVDDAMARMRAAGVDRAAVIDDDERIVGELSKSDGTIRERFEAVVRRASPNATSA